MLKDWQYDIQIQRDWKLSKLNISDFVSVQRKYFNELSALANIKKVPTVYDALSLDAATDFTESPSEFRKYKYTIVNDTHFVKEKFEE